MTSTRRLALAAATALLAVTALSACGNQPAGAAATFGDSRISEQQLADEVAAIQEAKGEPIEAADSTLVQRTLSRMLTIKIVDELAAQRGVVVTQGQVDALLAQYEEQVGGAQQLEETLISQDVAPSQVQDMARLQVQAQAVGADLDPTGTPDEQSQAVFEAAALLSADLDTTVAPRFGTWDPQGLTISASPDDLSTPPLPQ